MIPPRGDAIVVFVVSDLTKFGFKLLLRESLKIVLVVVHGMNGCGGIIIRIGIMIEVDGVVEGIEHVGSLQMCGHCTVKIDGFALRDTKGE